jgi:hypothetical protein
MLAQPFQEIVTVHTGLAAQRLECVAAQRVAEISGRDFPIGAGSYPRVGHIALSAVLQIADEIAEPAAQHASRRGATEKAAQSAAQQIVQAAARLSRSTARSAAEQAA